MRVLVFQHHAAEHPGAFRGYFNRDGAVCDTVRLDAGDMIPELHAYDALLVLGGAMDVWQEDEFPWLRPEKAAIRSFVLDLNRPYLGICLGHQLLVDALGGRVGKMRAMEIGVHQIDLTQRARQDSIFGRLPQTLPTVQWHGADVQQLPADAAILASNFHCPVQAIRVGRQAYGIQYHAEVDRQTLEDWSEVETYICGLEAVNGPGAHHVFNRLVQTNMVALTEAGAALYEGFIEIIRRNRSD